MRHAIDPTSDVHFALYNIRHQVGIGKPKGTSKEKQTRYRGTKLGASFRERAKIPPGCSSRCNRAGRRRAAAMARGGEKVGRSWAYVKDSPPTIASCLYLM